MTDRHEPWVLAIDLGTTTTAAAIGEGDRVEVLELDGAPRLPSLVLLGDGGSIVVGRAAEEQARIFPGRAEPSPKRYLGVARPMLIDGRPVRAIDAIARILEVVLAEARRRRGGTDPVEVRLTHPARWAGTRIEALLDAARRAGIAEPHLVPEPVAAAVYLAARVEDGRHVAVYDLGGGTFDTAVLRRSGATYELAGAPGGDERIGGDSFDHALARHLGARLEPDVWASLSTSDERRWRTARAEFRGRVRAAKEALSRDSDYTLLVPFPVERELRITRPEFEDLVREDLVATVAELEATIAAAELGHADIAAICLVGGSSRVPLAGRLLADRFGRAPMTWDDPKAVTSLGAARLALAERRAAAATTEPPGRPVDGEPAAVIPPAPSAVLSVGTADAPVAAASLEAAIKPAPEPAPARAAPRSTPVEVAPDRPPIVALRPPATPPRAPAAIAPAIAPLVARTRRGPRRLSGRDIALALLAIVSAGVVIGVGLDLIVLGPPGGV